MRNHERTKIQSCHGCNHEDEGGFDGHKWEETIGSRRGDTIEVCDLCWAGPGSSVAMYGAKNIDNASLIAHMNVCTRAIITAIKEAAITKQG